MNRYSHSHFSVVLVRTYLADYWDRKLSELEVSTPDPDMDVMLNTWTLYQSEINVMFSRFASFIEVGGRTGLGYRDTAQDAMTIPHSNPEGRIHLETGVKENGSIFSHPNP